MRKTEKTMKTTSDIAANENQPMTKEHAEPPHQNETGFIGSLRFRYGLVLAVFLALGGYFLWQEHEVHIVGYLPLILALGACLGMHFFMHGAHGGHGGGHKGDKE